MIARLTSALSQCWAISRTSESTIELTHARITFAEFAGGILTLFDKHEVEARLNIAGDFKTDQFSIRNEAGNAFITLIPAASDLFR